MTIVGVPLVLIVLPIYLLTGGLKKFGLRALDDCFQGIRVHDHPQPGDVSFRYHTYRGFLLWFVQSEHVVTAPADDSERLLGRLFRYNLTWGLLAYGVLVIPVLASANYLAQKRSIRRQVAQFGGSVSGSSRPSPGDE